MASDECRSCWQSYNFPYSGQENVSQSFIDYSSASVLNIDLDDHDESLIIHSKKLHNSRPQRLSAKHQSLPFLGPNISSSSSLPETTMNDRHLGEFFRSDEFNPNCPTVHVDNFSMCHPDIMYRTTLDLLREEVNCDPWSSCRNMRYSIDLSKRWKGKQGHCQMCLNFRKALKYHDNNNYLQVLKHLGTTLPDISPSLLENLLQESISLETSQLQFDTFMGNSLACQVLDGSRQALLMYPSGAGLDTLNFSNILQFSGAFDNALLRSEPILSNQQFSLQGQIRQIDFSSFSGNNIIVVGTRSQYNCSFFQSYPNDSTEGNLLSFKPLETVAVTKQAMCLAVSPYVPGEGVVVTETGGMYLWRCGQGVTTMRAAAQCDNSDDSPWYQCVFAANPQCVAIANAKALDLLDFRAGKLFQRFFFSIPSPEVDSFECISSIQRHPQNFHHYILATDQSLMLLDDRYLQHPVLKWRHHNEDPVQLINVVCDAILQCDDTVLVISGSNHQQTHCFQMSSGSQVSSDKPSPCTPQQCNFPPQSTSLPWKVSSYSEWYYEGLRSNLPFSQAASSRLSQPLIGVCTMPHPSHPRKGFTVFQMSSAGDLFYQPFFSQDIERSEGEQARAEQRQELGTEAKSLCQKWIDASNQGMHDLEQTTSCPGNYVEVDKTALCLDFQLIPSPHPSCVLCNDTENVELHQADGHSIVCERCGLDLSYGSKLVEHQKTNKVLTASSLGIKDEVKDLGIFPDYNKATDPLSKSLLVNWTSDEPIPVFNDELTQMNSHEPVVPDTKDGPMRVHNIEPILSRNGKPLPGSSDRDRPPLLNVAGPTLVNADKPVLENSKKLTMSSNRPVTVRNEPIPGLLTREKEEENQSIEGAKANVILPSRGYSLSTSVMSPARKIKSETLHSKRNVQATSQIRPVKNTPKKKKQTDHVMGF